MVTAILILVALVIVVALVGMIHLAINGDFLAQMWFVFGGAGQLIEVLFAILPKILEGLLGSSD